jgi:hypothetical protein
MLLTIATGLCNAQNKSGYTWIVGANGSYGQFDGSSNKPQVGQLYNSNSPAFPYIYSVGHSNICDSSSGKLLFTCNGMIIYDTTGNIMQNGDSLQPPKIYTQNAYPSAGISQGSIILPKGANGQYYVFIPTISDSSYTYFVTNVGGGGVVPYDLLRYNVVDMQANAGLGSVVEKNKILLKDAELIKVGMQACKHANGRDWWLIKQGGYGKNELIKYLVTKDSIYGPYTQTFAEPAFEYFDLTGQIAFSPDGTKFASAISKNRQLFLADFDRCSGEFSNPQVKYIPIDSSTIPNPLPHYLMDSISYGVCFSPNGNYLYLSKRWNIYQYEYGISDSSLAWVRIKHGPDTTYNAFEYYGHLYRGPDNRIYIGKGGGSFKQMSVLDYPNSKGLACGFCRKCFRIDTAGGGLCSPPNMPDYTLGADMSKVCWPLSTQQNEVGSEHVVVWPNPSNYKIKVESIKYKDATKYLYNSIGQMVMSTKENVIDVSNIPKGVYYLRVENQVVKVVVE